VEQRTIEIQKREGTGKSAVRRLRREGLVPVVVYSGGAASISGTVNQHELLMTARGCSPTQLFTFKSADKTLNGVKAFIKEVQTEPIRDQVLHVDFLSVEAGRSVIIEVNLQLVGEPADVKAGLAVLEQRAYGLLVECDPDLVPQVLTVSVASLTPGQAVTAAEVELPANVALRSNPGLTVAAVTATRAGATAGGKEEGK
jgi:large subunit ribosomal protein L25